MFPLSLLRLGSWRLQACGCGLGTGTLSIFMGFVLGGLQRDTQEG